MMDIEITAYAKDRYELEKKIFELVKEFESTHKVMIGTVGLDRRKTGDEPVKGVLFGVKVKLFVVDDLGFVRWII